MDSTDLLIKINPGFPFQLKKLFCYVDLDENIRKFFRSQAGTIETLEAECFTSEFHEMVLTKFLRIRSLKTNFDRLEASPEFYRNLKPLPLLTKIISERGFSSRAAMRAVLRKCPSFQYLNA